MLIPFDYDLALLAITVGSGRVITRAGNPVKLTGLDDDDQYPIVGIVEGNNTIAFDNYCGGEYCWTMDGKYFSYKDSNFDLFIEELC